MSALAAPLKLCTPQYEKCMSYVTLHAINKRATPPQMLKYKLALQLYKLDNYETQTKDWITLSFNQNFNPRNTMANFGDTSNYKFGKNTLPNRLPYINNFVEYDWLNYYSIGLTPGVNFINKYLRLKSKILNFYIFKTK